LQDETDGDFKKMKSNSKLKVIFMGGNLLGCTCLRYLVRAKNIKVLLVVGCYQDNGSVVEPKVWNASIARVALNKNLPFIQPKSTKNLQFINEIQKLDRPDLIITVEYDKILDPLILSIPDWEASIFTFRRCRGIVAPFRSCGRS
jgi:methionyl-tRNA formyltransferase